MKKFYFALVLAVLFASGCAKDPTKEPGYYSKMADASGIKGEPVVVRASGYGVALPKPDLTPMQTKLLGMRAAKVDAYRNLAERLYGTKVSGGSNLANLSAKDDRVKAYVNSIVKGAKVVANYELGNGGYETVLEVVLQPVIKRCLTKNGVVADKYCTNLMNTTDAGEANADSSASYPKSETPKAPVKSRGRYQVY